MQRMGELKARLGIACSLLLSLSQSKMWWAIPVVAVPLLLGLITLFGTPRGKIAAITGSELDPSVGQDWGGGKLNSRNPITV